MSTKGPIRFILALLIVLVIAVPVITETLFRFDKEFLKKAEEKCGKDAPVRFTAWEELIHKDKSTSDREKLDKVNNFYNSKIRFASDMEVWGVEDYWASPIEFLCRKTGDCEDFAIAKFFTLKAMGVIEDKLNIAYVKALQYNIAHMVLTYYSEPGAEPLVLDNLIDSIEPASKRRDLMPVFSFNTAGLWTAKERGKGKLTGGSDRLKAWQGLQQKMSKNEL